MRGFIIAAAMLVPIPAYADEISDYVDGITTSAPHIIQHRPRTITGKLQIDGKTYDFVSGGHGWSIPFGDYPITPKAVGGWGKDHGAIGINDGTIHDPQLRRDRDGILIHATNHPATGGCVGILEGFEAFKHDVFDMIEKAGRAFLHVGPTGAAITEGEASPLPPFVFVADSSRAEVDEEEPQHYHHKSTKAHHARSGEHRHYASHSNESHSHRHYASHRHLRHYASR